MNTSRSSGTVVAAIVGLVMVSGFVYRYWPSDEREIRRHLSNLAEGLSIPADDVEVTRMTRFAALAEYFAPNVEIRVDDARVVVTRDAVIARIEAVRPPPGGIAVEFVDVQIEPIVEGANAHVTLTAKVSQLDPATAASLLEQWLVRGEMSKASGDWLIVSADATSIPASVP